MKKILLLCVCLVVMSVTTVGQKPSTSGWKEFHPQEGWFTLEFPGDLVRKVDETPLPGRLGPSIEYDAGLLDKAGVVVKAAEFLTPVPKDEKSMNAFYDHIGSTVLEGMKGKLITQRSVMASTTLGREFEYSVGTRIVKQRMFYTADARLLQLIVVIPGEYKDEPQLLKAIARFFDSFKIVEKY
ncbi:MAG TPA: hypothetical protein VEV84_01155 [Pyrinomonadaceae bacterium]|nr:hypothetical protein [Pyrinomonadaceae bacterium]